MPQEAVLAEPELQRTINVRISAALGDRLDAIARRENNYVSAVTRRLLSVAVDLEDEAHAATLRRSMKRGA